MEEIDPIQPKPAKRSKPAEILTEAQLEARREATRLRVERHRNRKKEEAKTVQMVNFAATDSLKEKDARQIISDVWGVTRSHLIDTVFEWGCRAAERLKISKSHFFWTNGPVQTLASMKANEPLPLLKPEIENVIDGEVTYGNELYALYQFCEAWRPDANPTFEDYLAERRSVKTGGTISLGNKYFGKNFAEKPHAKWDEFVVRWNPDGVKPNYSQEEAKAWLGRQSEFKKRLLIASRSSYKSTFSLVSLIPAVLSMPDIRILLISETRPLSKSFIEGFRSMWTVKDQYNPSKFCRLFPEFCIPPDTGSVLEFNCPMAHLDLFQATAESSSMDSTVAGRRMDICITDDPISNVTVATEDQRNKSVVKFDAIMELLEVGGYVQINCTPWHIEDLSAVLLERNARSADKSLLYIVDPCWVIEEEAKKKNLFDLTEDDIESYLFPSRMDWKYLSRKIRDGDADGRTFRMQQMCEFLEDAGAEEKLQFDRETLDRNVIPFAPANDDQVYASGDLGFAYTPFADKSCFTVFKVVESQLVVLTQEAGNWRDSEKATKIVELQRRYPKIRKWVVERYPTFERLAEDVATQARRNNTSVSIHWSPIETTLHSKFYSLKTIETYIAAGRIKFVAGTYTAELFSELTRLDGTGPKRKSTKLIKDDRGDSLSIGVRFFLPSGSEDDMAARIKMEQEEETRRLVQEQHARIFGPSSPCANVSTASDWSNANRPTDLEDNEPHEEYGRNYCWPRRNANAPVISFGYQKDKNSL